MTTTTKIKRPRVKTLYGSSGTIDGLKSLICRYYCSPEWKHQIDLADNGEIRKADKVLSLVWELKRGRYRFGTVD